MGDTLSGRSVKKKKRRFPMDERDEEQRDFLSNHVKKKANMEQKRLKLDEERFEFDKDRRNYCASNKLKNMT